MSGSISIILLKLIVKNVKIGKSLHIILSNFYIFYSKPEKFGWLIQQIFIACALCVKDYSMCQR